MTSLSSTIPTSASSRCRTASPSTSAPTIAPAAVPRCAWRSTPARVRKTPINRAPLTSSSTCCSTARPSFRRTNSIDTLRRLRHVVRRRCQRDTPRTTRRSTSSPYRRPSRQPRHRARRAARMVVGRDARSRSGRQGEGCRPRRVAPDATSRSTAGSPRPARRCSCTGSAYDGRQPIGTDQAINAMTPELLRRFYDTWYRPDNAAIMVVGDIDVDDMEAEIRDRFEPSDPSRRLDTANRTRPCERSAPADATVLVDPDATTGDVEVTLPGPVRSPTARSPRCATTR